MEGWEQAAAGGGTGPPRRGWQWGTAALKVLVLERGWDLTCLAEVGGQDRAVGWVRVAHELLPTAVVLGPSVRGSDGCRSPQREGSIVLMGNVPLLPRQRPAL